MRNAILGTVAGLAVGTLGALAYSHFTEGSLLADLEAKLADANAKLAKAEADRKQLAQQTSGESAQLDELVKSNDSLKQQVATMGGTTNAPAATPPKIDPALMAAMGAMRGGFGGQGRMFLMQTRLKLTPDQAKAIKDAMDADQKARRDLMRQRFQGGTIDPTALANANTLDKTLQSVLNPNQQAQYKQLQADEKASRAETQATSQVNQLMPLVQMSDTQKQQALDALYQVQMNAQDPMTIATSANPVATVTSQGQAVEAALAKVLTPDQLTLYQQQLQAQADAASQFGAQYGGRRNRGGNDGGGPPPPPGN